MKNMQDFHLCTESDRAKFFEICRLIEVIFPGLEKQDLLIDFDMSMIQPYKSTDKNITIINDIEEEFIYARADFDLSKYIETL
ncbi:MAG: hypothetical protein J6L89_01525 [Clostridia bacterium]|nr:hypothetical protein [Clostridia bacterium]